MKEKDKPLLIWEVMSDKKHKVMETRKRSLLKGFTARALEVTFDTFVLSKLGIEVEIGLAFSVLLEVVCYVVSYLNERGWDKIAWGRKIEHV